MERDIMQLYLRYESGASVLQEAVRGLTTEELDTAPQPGKWSIRQIAVHLADAELVYTHRIRKVLAEHSGMLTVFDQDAWTSGLATSTVPVETAVQVVSALRAFNAVVIRSLPAEAFDRCGLHEVNGNVSAYTLLEQVANHLYHHVEQIQAIRKSIRR